MYRLGEAKHTHRKFYAFLGSFILLIVLAGFLAFHFLTSNTEINNPTTVTTTKVSYDTTKQVIFSTPLFSISFPNDWKATTHSVDIPQPKYTWQGTVKDNASRWLSVYVDQAVSGIAVNRELSVQANGTMLDVLSDVSDNCTNFTGNANLGRGTTPAKWQGIDFVCDSGNYERDVVGIVSPNGLNNVTLAGTSGTHRFFITYTDSSVSPDYSIFINAIKSFKLK